MNTAEAITHLTTKLKKDKAYRLAWSANIAMAYKDNYHQYRRKTGKKVMNDHDRHVIANNAAEYFLNLLCNQIKYPKGR